MKADNKLDKARSVSYTKLALSFLLTVFKLLAGFFGNSRGFAIFRNIPLFSIISADKVYFVEKFV